MTTQRTTVKRSYWIDIDEAAKLLSARPDDVVSLVRDGVLGARVRGVPEIALRAAEVMSLAQALPRPRRSPGHRPTGSRGVLISHNAPNTVWGSR
jgi:hypothetical protein